LRSFLALSSQIFRNSLQQQQQQQQPPQKQQQFMRNRIYLYKIA